MHRGRTNVPSSSSNAQSTRQDETSQKKVSLFMTGNSLNINSNHKVTTLQNSVTEEKATPANTQLIHNKKLSPKTPQVMKMLQSYEDTGDLKKNHAVRKSANTVEPLESEHITKPLLTSKKKKKKNKNKKDKKSSNTYLNYEATDNYRYSKGIHYSDSCECGYDHTYEYYDNYDYYDHYDDDYNYYDKHYNSWNPTPDPKGSALSTIVKTGFILIGCYTVWKYYLNR